MLYRKGSLNITADALSRSIETVQVVNPDYDALRDKVQKNATKYAQFRVVRDRIYKKVASAMGDSRYEWKYFPPRKERLQFLQEVHDNTHFGRYKTLKKLQE